jgi:FkbM family methyltransferase
MKISPGRDLLYIRSRKLLAADRAGGGLRLKTSDPSLMAAPRRGKTLRRILYQTLPLETYLLLLSQGLFLAYRLGLLRGNHLYKYLYFLPDVIRRGDVALDIGANLGYYTRLLAQWVGAQGQVHAVEPVEVILKVLRRNVRAFAQVTVHPYALGPADQAIQLGNKTRQSTGFMASGSNFVLEQPAEGEIDTFEAQMRRPQGLFGALDRIDFIKIDIEGYENALLPHLADLIRQHQPMVLIESRREPRTETIRQLEALGMSGYVLEGAYLIPLAQMPISQEDMFFLFPKHRERVQAYLQPQKGGGNGHQGQ